MERLWIGILVFVPLLPKVAVVFLGGTPFLLDDLALFFAIAVAAAQLLLQASVTGNLRLCLSRAATVFGALVLYKCLVLALLSLFLPWTDRGAIGKGVLVTEGVLVISKSLVFFSSYVLLYTALRTASLIRFVLNLFILSIVVVVSIGVFQYFVLEHNMLTSTFRNVHLISKPVASGGFGLDNPWSVASGVGHEHLGAFAVMSACLLGGMLLCRWPHLAGRRTLICLLLLGCLFCLVFASSRGAWIGGLCALAAFVWFVYKKQQVGRLFGFFLLVAGGTLLLRWIWGIDIIDFVIRRTTDLSGIYSGEVTDDSAKSRLHLLGGLWNIFLSSPLIGWGPGGAGRIAEGQLMRELVEGGVLGAGLFAIIMVRTGRIAYRSYCASSDPMVQGVSMGFICGLVGLLGQTFFTELFVLTKIGTPFWLLAAVVHRFSVLERLPSSTT